MSKRIIPSVPKSADQARIKFDEVVRENLQVITGQRVAPITELLSTASLDDVILKVNELIQRLQ